jgi:type IV secretory pathway protease TraF
VGDTIAYDIDEFYALCPQVREERMNFIAPRILKTVAGLPGALIEMSGDIVTINGTAYPRARVAGGSWRKVEYPLVVPEGTVWLMANSETAYDSRYHGPLPENIIKEKMVPILVIKK